MSVCVRVHCAWIVTDVPLAAQEVLGNLRDRWYQADNPPADLLLTEDEFLSFLHPEHSRGMLKFMVKEIFRDLGKTFPHCDTVLGPRVTNGLGAWAEDTKPQVRWAWPICFLRRSLGGT